MFASIAQQYENVITTYNVTRLDLGHRGQFPDQHTAGIDRRNKAIKMVEDWGRRETGRTVQFSYTLPTHRQRPRAGPG